MTRRSYADLDRHAPNGRWRLEARSPDNGNPMQRDGIALESRRWGCFQREFRYRLFDEESGTVVWARWQDETVREGSPVDAWVTDSGEVILRTHAGSWMIDTLLVVDHEGRVRLAIDICDMDTAAEPLRPEPRPDDAPVAVWADPHVQTTTAGPMWGRAFLTTDVAAPQRCFVLCAPWGRRLVIDLDGMALLDDDSTSSAEIDEAVRARARSLLATSSRAEVDHLRSGLSSELLGAVLAARAYGMTDVLPVLRHLEAATTDQWSWSQSSGVLGEGHQRRVATARGLVHLALRSLGAPPHTPPAVGFESPNGETTVAPRGSMDAILELRPGCDGRAVLAAVGAPDHAHSISRKHGRRHVWSAIWEYDGPACTARLIWSFPAADEPADAPRRLVRVETIHPPAWVTTERQMQLIGRFL